MVSGKRGFSVVLLVFGVVISVYMVLLADPTSAQNGGGTTSPTTNQNNQPNGDCPGAEVVEEITGTGAQQTAPFDILGDRFLITYEVSGVDNEGPDIDPSLSIAINEGDGDFVDLITQEGEGTDTSFVNVEPGGFFLDISAFNAEYTITVEDCTEAGQDDGDNDQEPTNRNQEPRQQEKSEAVINIPNKPLPPTGGLPVYGMVASFILAGAGLLGLGIGIRRNQRR